MAKRVKDEVKEELLESTGHAMVDKAKTPDKYEDVDTWATLVDLDLDHPKVRRDREGDAVTTISHQVVLKGEYAKGTPEEIIITVRYKCARKEDLKNFLKGRMTPEDEFNIKVR